MGFIRFFERFVVKTVEQREVLRLLKKIEREKKVETEEVEGEENESANEQYQVASAGD